MKPRTRSASSRAVHVAALQPSCARDFHHHPYGKVASGQAAALRWSGRRGAPTALRCSVSRPRRRTRCVRCALYAQTPATSQLWMRAARAAASPALLGAPEARRDLPGRAFAQPVGVLVARTDGVSRQAVPVGGAVCGGEKRRAAVGARSAHPQLTRRDCLSRVSAANAASFATRPQTEHRSGVGAQRRPPQPAPPTGTACRDARDERCIGQ